MNRICEGKYDKAMGLFCEDKSIRQVAKEVGIAKETAHRIQKSLRIFDVTKGGKTKILLGKRKDGSLSFYESSEIRPNWKA